MSDETKIVEPEFPEEKKILLVMGMRGFILETLQAANSKVLGRFIISVYPGIAKDGLTYSAYLKMQTSTNDPVEKIIRLKFESSFGIDSEHGTFMQLDWNGKIVLCTLNDAKLDDSELPIAVEALIDKPRDGATVEFMQLAKEVDGLVRYLWETWKVYKNTDILVRVGDGLMVLNHISKD